MKNKVTYNIRLILCVLFLVLIGLMIEIGGAYLLNVIFSLFPNLDIVQEGYNDTIDVLTSMEPKMVVYVSFFAPLVEELIFRQGLIGLGRKLIKFRYVNILQAVLFGIYHGNVVQGTYAFLLGLFIGAMFEYGGGYLTCFIIHVVINTSGLYVIPHLPQTLPVIYESIIALVCFAVCGLAGLYVAKVNKIGENQIIG